MPKEAAIAFACRYAGESFSEFDEYVQASLDDFLNLHNGLFLVNMSNDMGVELQLEPPMEETGGLLSFKEGTFLFPILYPFGMIYFIFEVCKND